MAVFASVCCLIGSPLGAAAAVGDARLAALAAPLLTLDAPESVRVGELISFTASLSGNTDSVQYRFVFSDIAPSESDWGKRPLGFRLFTSTGEVSVHVEARRNVNQKTWGMVASEERTIRILPALPTIALKTVTRRPKAGQTVEWSVARKPAGALVYDFDPGDGTGAMKGTGPTIEHIYADAGKFTASVRLLNEETRPESRVTVRVAPAPAPTLTVAPSAVEIGDRVTFTAADVGGNATTRFRFDFGDNTPPTPWRSAPTATHAYAASGTFQPFVEITRSKDPNALAEARSAAGKIDVRPALSVTLERLRGSTNVGDPVRFEVTVNRPETAPSVTVDFGDGTSSDLAGSGTVTHVFRRPQAYHVTVLAEATIGRATAARDVVIEAVPPPELEVERTPAEIGKAVRLTARFRAANQRTLYRFLYGDGTPPSPWNKSSTIDHPYDRAGIFSASVEVAVALPGKPASEPLVIGTSAAREVEILPAFEVAIKPVTDETRAGDAVEFAISTTRPDPAPAYTVTFDDGTKTAGASPATLSHIFNTSGPHRVTVSAKSRVGEARNETTINVSAAVPPMLAASPSPAEIGETVELTATPSSSGAHFRYRFDFDDGAGQKEWQPTPKATHTYGRDGTFRPSVEVGIARGNTVDSLKVRAETTLKVWPILTVNLRPQEPEIFADRKTVFAVESNRPDATVWLAGAFGDGSAIGPDFSDKMLEHVFPRKGDYEISWTARAGRAVATGKLTVPVKQSPLPPPPWLVVLAVTGLVGALITAGIGAHRLGWLRPSLHPNWNLRTLRAEAKETPGVEIEFHLNHNLASCRHHLVVPDTTAPRENEEHPWLKTSLS